MGDRNPSQLAEQLMRHDRAALSRAITLVESRLETDRSKAQELLTAVLPKTGQARRIGISGAPGAGKSTLIESLGLQLCEAGKSVAVLAVDPSSSLSGGSILGDKSRMHRLSQHEHAFIRPSPNAGSAGGVALRTRESLLCCEAAGFDVILIETVGVGQSETLVSEMVDSFLLVIGPGSGDELQGIKKGVVELADVLAINKADGKGLALATETAREYSVALRYLRPSESGWRAPTVLISALESKGLDELWNALEAHREQLQQSGQFESRRKRQLSQWTRTLVRESLMESFYAHPSIQRELDAVLKAVEERELPPALAAAQLLAAYRGNQTPKAT